MSAKPALLSSSLTFSSMNPDTAPRCSTHRKRLKFFCLRHELLLCSVCAVKQHRTCGDVLTISEAAEDKAVEGRKLLDLQSKNIALIENAIVERKAAKKLLETNVQEIRNEIHEVTEKLIDLVKHEERTLVDIVQSKQKHEAESLDKDIEELDAMCDDVRQKHESLSQNLKCSEIDLIYAVLKEKQQPNTCDKIDNIVKKNFREVDFKFMVSPHITSFLRHFKSLGQVILSNENNSTTRVPRSSSSTPVSDHTPPSTNSENGSLNDSAMSPPFSGDSVISAREKWQRDRMRQMQSQLRSKSSNDTVFRFDNLEQTQTPKRRNLPMRALPRPETPDFAAQSRSQPIRREYVPRPMSTPPVETSVSQSNPKLKDVDRFGTYHTEREHWSPGRRRVTSPCPDRREEIDNRHDLHRIEPVYVYNDRRRAPSPFTPSSERSPTWSHTTSNGKSPICSVIAVKEDEMGRSFAAVQMKSPPTQFQQNGFDQRPQSPYVGLQEQRPPKPARVLPSTEREAYPDGHDLNETGRFTPTSLASPRVSFDENGRRWVHRLSFTSSGHESKRLISGLTVLRDGRMVVIDQESYTVQLYDADSRFIHELKLDSRPFDVTADSSNKIVVSLQSESLLKFVLVTETELISFAELGLQCDKVCYGICKGGRFYCVCCADEIRLLSEDGRHIKTLKTDKNGKELFTQAEYIAINDDRNILYVSDHANNKVMAITLEARVLWEFSYPGFCPSGLAFLDQNVLVCDGNQSRVLMLNAHGQVCSQSVIGRLENARAISINEAGDQLLVSQMRYGEVNCPAKPVHVYTLQETI